MKVMRGHQQWKFLFISAPFGGIEVFSKNLKQVVDERDDIDASWIWIEPQPKEFFSRISPLSMNWTLKGGYAAWSRVKKLERSGNQFDAVFFNHIIPARFLSGFRKRVPTVFSLDVTPEVLAPYSQLYYGREIQNAGMIFSIKHRMLKEMYHDASYLLAWSDLVRQSLVEDYGVPPEKVDVVPPGIDLKQWVSSSHENIDTKDGLQPIRILFVGGEFKRKGGDLLLRIAQRNEFRNCEFHFVTKSFEGVRGENVFVYPDIKPNSVQLLDLYRKADIFALPTRADFSPQAVCEAFGFRLPVVTTNVGGLSEIVTDGENGFLTAPDDEEAFAKKIFILVQSSEMRKNFGGNGRLLVEEKYDINKNTEIVLQYLKKAVIMNEKNLKISALRRNI
jgi:glycosyltransferase involved in cell wall biosynthesis